MVTESDAFVQTECIRSYIYIYLNLEPHERQQLDVQTKLVYFRLKGSTQHRGGGGGAKVRIHSM